MKIILALLSFGLMANACPNINGTFACTESFDDSPNSPVMTVDLTVKTIPMPGGHQLIATSSFEGESYTEILNLNPVSDLTDEEGIRTVSYCQGDKIVADSSYRNLAAKMFISTKNGDLVFEGTSITIYADTDENGQIIESSKEYKVESANSICKKK